MGWCTSPRQSKKIIKKVESSVDDNNTVIPSDNCIADNRGSKKEVINLGTPTPTPTPAPVLLELSLDQLKDKKAKAIDSVSILTDLMIASSEGDFSKMTVAGFAYHRKAILTVADEIDPKGVLRYILLQPNINLERTFFPDGFVDYEKIWDAVKTYNWEQINEDDTPSVIIQKVWDKYQKQP